MAWERFQMFTNGPKIWSKNTFHTIPSLVTIWTIDTGQDGFIFQLVDNKFNLNTQKFDNQFRQLLFFKSAVRLLRLNEVSWSISNSDGLHSSADLASVLLSSFLCGAKLQVCLWDLWSISTLLWVIIYCLSIILNQAVHCIWHQRDILIQTCCLMNIFYFSSPFS